MSREDEDDHPDSPKAAAVEMWRDALDDLPGDTEWASVLRESDIHDQADRWEVEEVIEHEVPEDSYLPLHDAWHELQTHFEEEWS